MAHEQSSFALTQMLRKNLMICGLIVFGCSLSSCSSFFHQLKPVGDGKNSPQTITQPSIPSHGNRVTTIKTEKDQSTQALLMSHFSEWEGTRYRLGGLSQKGIDCSGFVYLTYREKLGIQLPRTTSQQIKMGEKVSKRNLKVGDLIFFKTGRKVRHVGIYVGNNEIIHASSSRGVTKTSLSQSYWKSKYWKAKRVKI